MNPALQRRLQKVDELIAKKRDELQKEAEKKEELRNQKKQEIHRLTQYREQEKDRQHNEEIRRKAKFSAAAADSILRILRAGDFSKAQKFFRLAVENNEVLVENPSGDCGLLAGSLDLAAIRRLASGFKEHGNCADLNIRRLIIKDGENENIIPIVAALLPCVSETNLIEALNHCAKYKDFYALLDPILRQLPDIQIPELPVLGAIEHGDVNVLALLLKAGACPNFERGPFGITSLHAAIHKGGEFVKILLLAKASPNLTDTKTDSTPLHEACKLPDAKTSQRIVKLMIQHGEIDLGIKNRQKKTALDVARHALVKEMLTQEKLAQLQRKNTKSKKKTTQVPASGTPLKESPVSGVEQQSLTGHLDASQAQPVQKKKEEAPPVLSVEQRLVLLQASLDSSVVGTFRIDSETAKDKGTDRHLEVPVAAGPKKSVSTEIDTPQVSASHDCSKLSSVVLVSDNLVSTLTAQTEQHEAEFDLTRGDEISATIFSSGATWDLRFTREFKEQLFALHRQPLLLQSLVRNLGRLATGEQSRGLFKSLKGVPKSLRIYESPVKSFNDGGRFLWQYSVDYSPRIRGFTDCIRLWRLCLQHDDVPKGIEWIVQSHKRGRSSTMKKGLISSFQGSTLLPDGRRVPRQYDVCDGVDENLLLKDGIQFELLTTDEEDPDKDDQDGQILFTPPAVSNADSYNVLKFYQLSDEVLQTLRTFIPTTPHDPREESGLSRTSLVPEFPFIPDDREDLLISSNQGSSILLVGRSGTGKTSIAVGRMWDLYKHSHAENWHGGAYNQVFVTANRVLRDQVRKSFQGMKHGFQGGQHAVFTDYPHTFSDVPVEMFPLFLTQGEYLKMLDGSLTEPFWQRNEDGSVKQNIADSFHEEEGMLDGLPDEDFDDWSDSENDENDVQQFAQQNQTDADETRLEVDFEVFYNRIWPRLSRNLSRIESKNVSPGSLFQEIHSYIKGSAESLRSPNGRLSREEYNSLGAKMAPNFNKSSQEDLPGDRSGCRDFVYDLYEQYEKEKRVLRVYICMHIHIHIYMYI